jgi:hypothetical protein
MPVWLNCGLTYLPHADGQQSVSQDLFDVIP